MSSAEVMNNLSTLTYPRTGKRGVPQQFPRRLYEMLESEAKLATESPEETYVISWSESGKAFRILDVEVFATTVLPRYFRTKKFSSFQRNLNLYGFAKVRRGPDTDMYAHPSFARGKPELLSLLKKSTSASRRRSSSQNSNEEADAASAERSTVRSVSPSPPRAESSTGFHSLLQNGTSRSACPPSYLSQTWLTFNRQSLSTQTPSVQKPSLLPMPKKAGIGRLDLLALAIEHAA